ncbi:MAG: hemolysin family protein [Alphaproteobacteria bacterium]|nr:hemolysin family protein [Alphaproteobacteria bacterium]
MDEPRRSSLPDWLRNLFSCKHEASLKDAIEEAIEEHAENSDEEMAPQERVMLHNVLSFGERTVSDIMIPRTDIVAVSHDISLENLKAHLLDQRHTRTPVYEDTLDHVLGFLHVKDIIPVLAGDKPYHLRTYLRSMLYVPPSMKILDLLAKMRGVGSHMAIVVDEHGGTDGLVTMEDVVEEIVGEIHDEHDEDEMSDEQIVRISDKVVEVSARIRIEHLVRALNRELVREDESEGFDTLAGLIFTRLGRIPAKGEMVEHYDGIRFEIADADARHIRKVRVHLG